MVGYGDLRRADKAPVVLLPGTTLTPDANFHWNYIPALRAEGHPVCTASLPEQALGDIQIPAPHVAYAIRKAFLISRRKVSVIGSLPLCTGLIRPASSTASHRRQRHQHHDTGRVPRQHG